jgi:Chitobiase/beta-hexosaminidase C-terminal domain
VKRVLFLLACIVFAAVVVGEPLADTVTGPTLTLSESSAFESVSGSTLYYAPTGSNSGSFTVDATASAPSLISSIDFPAVFGSDSLSDTTSPYSQTYSWTSASNTSGVMTVAANDGDADTGTADFTVTPDTTGPTGVSVALNGGPGFSTPSVPLTLSEGSDAGAGVNSSADTVQRATGALSNGSCSSFGPYADVSLGGGADTTVTTGHCYSYEYQVTDLVGNTTTSSASDNAMVDNTAPTATPTAPTEVAGPGDQYWDSSTTTLWFRPAGAGSFLLAATGSDADSGITQLAFPDLTGTSGWSGVSSTDPTAPYASGTYAWSAGAAAPGAKPLTATNGTGLTGSGTVTISADSTPPTGQTIALSGGPWFSTPSVTLTIGAGTDTGAGVDSNRGVVQRASAPLTNGACGTFGSFATVAVSGGSDTTVTSGNCYRYQYEATDNVGNVSTASASTGDAKVDTTPPTAPSLLFTSMSGAVAAGSTVYYQPAGAGSFTVTASSSDADSGVASYTFPVIPGFTMVGSGASRTYTAPKMPPTAPGPVPVTATNGSGQISPATTLTLAPDGARPTVTILCNGKSCASTAYPRAVTVTLSAVDTGGAGVGSIVYTTDGTAPSTGAGSVYTKPLVVTSPTHLRVVAYDKAGNASAPLSVTINTLADRLTFTAPARVTVKAKARYVRARVRTSLKASVTAVMSGTGLKAKHVWRFRLAAGTSSVELRLPASIRRRHAYKLVWSVVAGTRRASKTTHVTLKG